VLQSSHSRYFHQKQRIMPTMPSKKVTFSREALSLLPVLTVGQVTVPMTDSPATGQLLPALLLTGLLVILHLLDRGRGTPSA